MASGLSGDGDAIPGWPTLSIPVEMNSKTRVGTAVVIDRDVRGFPNGFVGKVIAVQGGRTVVEALNPLTVFTRIRFSQTVDGAFAPATRTRSGATKAAFETECTIPELRRLLDKTRPDFTLTFENDGISVERFGVTAGLTLNDDGTMTFSAALSGRCQATISAPPIRGPLGIQINLEAGGYIGVAATGELKFDRMQLSASQGWMVTGDNPSDVGQPPALTPPVTLGGTLSLTLPGLMGRVGMQWPADINIGSFRAGASVEVFLEPDFALNQLVIPGKEVPDCAVQRQSQATGTVGVTAKAGIEAEVFGRKFGDQAEVTPFSYTWPSDPFWVSCLTSTVSGTTPPTTPQTPTASATPPSTSVPTTDVTAPAPPTVPEPTFKTIAFEGRQPATADAVLTHEEVKYYGLTGLTYDTPIYQLYDNRRSYAAGLTSEFANQVRARAQPPAGSPPTTYASGAVTATSGVYWYKSGTSSVITGRSQCAFSAPTSGTVENVKVNEFTCYGLLVGGNRNVIYRIRPATNMVIEAHILSDDYPNQTWPSPTNAALVDRAKALADAEYQRLRGLGYFATSS